MALGKNVKTGNKDQPKKSGVKLEEKKEVKESTKGTEASASKDTKMADKPAVKSKAETPAQAVRELNTVLDSNEQLEENSRMLVVFAVGNEEYAFDIDQIKEVVPVPSVSKVPQTKNYILGVANVRGNVLTVIDLEKRFGLQKKEEQKNISYVIVIKSEELKVAVASGQVPETLMIRESQMDSTADVVRKSHKEQSFIKGIIKRDKRMIIYIDVLEMLENEQPVNV